MWGHGPKTLDRRTSKQFILKCFGPVPASGVKCNNDDHQILLLTIPWQKKIFPNSCRPFQLPNSLINISLCTTFPHSEKRWRSKGKKSETQGPILPSGIWSICDDRHMETPSQKNWPTKNCKNMMTSLTRMWVSPGNSLC